MSELKRISVAMVDSALAFLSVTRWIQPVATRTGFVHMVATAILFSISSPFTQKLAKFLTLPRNIFTVFLLNVVLMTTSLVLIDLFVPWSELRPFTTAGVHNQYISLGSTTLHPYLGAIVTSIFCSIIVTLLYFLKKKK